MLYMTYGYVEINFFLIKKGELLINICLKGGGIPNLNPFHAQTR